MRAVNTLRLAADEVFFGPGPRLLLQKLRELSSLRQATLETGISYTKALRLIAKMERALGFAVVESERGGKTHGGTRLTPKGAQLLDAYIEAENEMNREAQRIVDEKLSFLLEG